jgi:aspartyl-tRNA(Asn)/glutamyl-tRNA(Gln) amidotransferase subunit B
VVTEEWIEKIEKSMPESLRARRDRMVELGLHVQQADQLTASRSTSSAALSLVADAPPKERSMLANWLLGPLSAKLNEENLDIGQSKVPLDQLRALSARVADGTVSATAATTVVIPALWEKEGSVDQIIEKRGLKQISDAGAIEKIVDDVLAKNAKQAEDYRAGKEKAFNSLVGQVMRATHGKANPAQVNAILKRKLAG